MQCCKVNGKLSKFEKVTCSVPQGSCLGPLLFILYINDLPLSLKHSQVNMYADDTSISFSANSIPVINEQYLGVYVDQHLSRDVQIANMVKKISKALGMLRYSKQYLPIKSVQTMYKSLVEPYFRYCCPVWGVCGITALDKLQKLQNRAARIVTNSPYNASALPTIRKLGWQTVNDLTVEETLKMVYKCKNDEAPSYLACLFGR